MNPDDVSRLGSFLVTKDNEEDEHLATEHTQGAWPIPYIVKLNEDPKKAALRSLIVKNEDLSVDEASGD